MGKKAGKMAIKTSAVAPGSAAEYGRLVSEISELLEQGRRGAAR